MKFLSLLVALSVFSTLFACANSTAPTTQPALTAMPAKEGTADYWLAQPAQFSVTSPNFFALWNACTQTLLFDQFDIDEQDQRLGVLTTFPMISKQFFEPWRSDAGTIDAILLDSLQTVRRTIRFDISRQPDGSFIASPKVLVEQSSHPSAASPRNISTPRPSSTSASNPTAPPTRASSSPTDTGLQWAETPRWKSNSPTPSETA